MKKIQFDFANISEQIRNLNPKEYYSWPLPIQLGIGVIVFSFVSAAGLFLDVFPTIETLDKVVEKENELKKEFIDKKRKAINLPLYEKQLEEITKDSDNLLKQLPDKSQIDKLLIDINQAGITRGLEFELFKPESEKLNEFYAELPINIKVVGSYDAIGNFTADIAQLSRVVLFSDMDISTKGGNVVMTATVKTFRYLDQQEIAAQLAIKKEKEKKNKKKPAEKQEKPANGHGGA